LLGHLLIGRGQIAHGLRFRGQDSIGWGHEDGISGVAASVEDEHSF
jgi:hypothetical protein